MPKKWNDWKNYWGNEEEWMYSYDEEKPYKKELKKAAVAGAIFLAFYAVQAVHSPSGEWMKGYVSQVLEWKMDVQAIADRFQTSLPNLDSDVLKRAQMVIAQPTNPYQYMTAPVEGEIVLAYRWQEDTKDKQKYWQDGIEYKVAAESKIKASSTGKVKSIAQTAEKGTMLVLAHANDIETVYGYLGEVMVKEGDRVTQGQVIASSGTKINSDVPMLYFGMREKGISVNPKDKMLASKL